MSGPFKMKGSGHYGHGNQKRKDGMPYAQYAQMAGAALGAMSKKSDDKDSEEPAGLDKENMPKSGAKYASPAKTDETSKKSKTNTVLPEVEVSGGKAGKSLATRNYEKRLEKKASEEYMKDRGTRSGGSDFTTTTEENKIKYRARAQRTM